MVAPVAAPVIGDFLPIVGKLLGGLFGNKSAKKQRRWALEDQQRQRDWALEDQREQFTRLRAAAEKGGFNPLAVLGYSGGGGSMVPGIASTDAGNYMGSAIADSALLLADNLASKTSAALYSEKNALAAENAKLKTSLTAATIRPKVGGVYDRQGAFGTGGYVAQRTYSASDRTRAFGAARAQAAVDDAMAGGVPLPDPLLDRSTGRFVGGVYLPPNKGNSPNQVVQNSYGDGVAQTQGWADYILNLGNDTRAVADQMGWLKPRKNYWKKWAGDALSWRKRNYKRGATTWSTL